MEATTLHDIMLRFEGGYLLRAKSGSHIITLRPTYILRYVAARTLCISSTASRTVGYNPEFLEHTQTFTISFP